LSYTQSFGYDQLNRLTTSQEGASWSQTNSYDRYGNRSIVGGALTFNAANNRITTAGYTYDVSGNLTNDTLHAYTFDAENKISKVDAVSAYVYNGEGQRVRKLLGENLRFIYDIDGKQIAEFDGSTGNLKKEYVQGGATLITIEPTALNPNGTRYTTSDTLGSPRVVTSSSAGVVSRHDYMPFGVELGAGVGGRTPAMGFSIADGLRQKFTQKERDNETGLDYFLARYYSSTQGRFTSPDEFKGGPEELFEDVDPHDPLFYADVAEPQSLNKYHYCLNNPLRYIDPNGHQTTTADRVKQAAATVVEFSGGVMQGAVSSFTFGRVGAPSPSDSRTNRIGQVVGTVAEGAAGLVVAGPGSGAITLDSGGVAAVTGVSEATVAVGATMTIGSVVNLAKIATTPMQRNTSGDSSTSNEPSSKKSKVEPSDTSRSLGGGKFTEKRTTRPGNGPGQSRAEYVRTRNSEGKVIRTYKDSYDRANRFQSRKPLRGGPEGRPHDQ